MPSPFAALTDRQRGALALVLGTVLLLSPLYATAFHVDGRAYTYRTMPVDAADGEIVVEGSGERTNEFYVAGVACTQPRWTRGCALDHHVLEDGPVSVSAGYGGGPEYTRVDGAYYRRVTVDAGGSEALALERVTAREVLDGVDVPRTSLTWPGRVAVLAGSVTTTYPLTHGDHVVDTGEGHVVLALTSYERAGGAGDDLASLAGVAAGLWLLVRGYDRLPTE